MKSKKILICVAVIVAIAGIGIGGYFKLSGNSTEKNPTQKKL